MGPAPNSGTVDLAGTGLVSAAETNEFKTPITPETIKLPQMELATSGPRRGPPGVGHRLAQLRRRHTPWRPLGVDQGIGLGGCHSPRARPCYGGGMAGSSGWFVEETVQRRLELSAATFASNQFGCTIRAAPGQAVVMEAFSNLVNWIPI